MKLLKNRWFWFLGFGVLFALSIDLWAWSWTGPSLFGLPYIIVYIAILEAILFVMFWAFIKFYWTDEKEGKP